MIKWKRKSKKSAEIFTDFDYELPRAKLLKGPRERIRKFLMIKFAESIEVKENWLKKMFLLIKCEKKWVPEITN